MKAISNPDISVKLKLYKFYVQILKYHICEVSQPFTKSTEKWKIAYQRIVNKFRDQSSPWRSRSKKQIILGQRLLNQLLSNIMAAALDSSILESSVNENGEIGDGKFKLTEFVMSDKKYSIVQDPILNLIKATFWKNIYGIFPKSQIDGLEIVFDIKKIEVIFNKDFQDSYDVLKTDMNGNEMVVFQGMYYFI